MALRTRDDAEDSTEFIDTVARDTPGTLPSNTSPEYSDEYPRQTITGFTNTLCVSLRGSSLVTTSL
ncbi:MAG: hypothetical protein E7Z70_08115 [Thermoplasmata archaeon]|nr:hypothetical protein [Thermoplasmata archaeon]